MAIMDIQCKALFKFYIFLKGSDRSEFTRGFTILELLVVITIIGFLAAISLPSFLNQANRARQSEGKTYIGAINRAQQVYISEKRRFACDLANLSVGIKTLSENYQYDIDCNIGFGLTNVTNQAKPIVGVKAYLGGISIVGDTDALVTVCEAKLPTISGGASGSESFYPLGFSTTAPPICPSEYTRLQ